MKRVKWLSERNENPQRLRICGERLRSHMTGHELRSRRKSRNMTQRHLAAYLGVGLNTVRRWEKMEHIESVDFASRLVAFLNNDGQIHHAD